MTTHFRLPNKLLTNLIPKVKGNYVSEEYIKLQMSWVQQKHMALHSTQHPHDYDKTLGKKEFTSGESRAPTFLFTDLSSFRYLDWFHQ